MKNLHLTTFKSHPSSFRDNSGEVFKEGDRLYRGVYKSYKEDYDNLFSSGLYQHLVDKKLLINHQEIVFTEKNSFYKILEPDFLPFISYPSEWSFSMLRDAALLTLNIQKSALSYNMVLKDASVYNIQFKHGRPVFIDLLSFETYKEGAPWQAYGQFCKHFLAPLALMSYTDVSLNKLFVTFLDGVPLDLAAKLLPLKAKFRIGLYIHLFLHSNISNKYNNKRINSSRLKGISKQTLVNLADNLTDTIKSIKWEPKGTEWADYYDKSTEKNYLDKKKMIISEWLDSRRVESILDIGANDGEFSLLASSKTDMVYSFDIDPACVDINYKSLKVNKIKNIYPLLIDFANPTPSYGWANQERDALLDRVKPELVMSLAVIHHLRITAGIPLQKQASIFSKLCNFLIIEFVPKQDEKVVTLLQNRQDIFEDYEENSFEEIFQVYFEILDKKIVSPSYRILYFLKRK